MAISDMATGARPRYEGPRGGPGMREMLAWAAHTVRITDSNGRAAERYELPTSFWGAEWYLWSTGSGCPLARSGWVQLSARPLGTNRDVPLPPVTIGQAARDAAEAPGAAPDFSIESGEPVLAAYILNGPTRPRPAP